MVNLYRGDTGMRYERRKKPDIQMETAVQSARPSPGSATEAARDRNPGPYYAHGRPMVTLAAPQRAQANIGPASRGMQVQRVFKITKGKTYDSSTSLPGYINTHRPDDISDAEWLEIKAKLAEMAEDTHDYGTFGRWKVAIDTAKNLIQDQGNQAPTVPTVVAPNTVVSPNQGTSNTNRTNRKRPATDTIESLLEGAEKRNTKRMRTGETKGLRYLFDIKTVKISSEIVAKPETQQVKTPSGPVTWSKRRKNDQGGVVSTRKGDYGGEKVGDKYDHIIPVLRSSGLTDPEIAQNVLDAMDDKQPFQGLKKNTKQVQNATSKLVGVISISERLRFGGAPKWARAVLRSITRGKHTLDEGFLGKTPLFGPAYKAKYGRDLAKGKRLRLKPRGWRDLVEDVSDDSEIDEE